MIFTDNFKKDYFAIMALIDAFSKKAKITVKEDELFALIQRIHLDFPCVNGLENANVFKKASTFLCEFVGGKMIEKIDMELDDKLTKISNHESAIIGLYIVITFFNGATVGDKGQTITNNIQLSEHSYIDIINSLHDISLQGSFKLVAVLLEQLVYKTNPKLQRKVFDLN